MRRLNLILFPGLFLVIIDYYVFQAVTVAFSGLSVQVRQVIYGFYWALTGLSITGLLVYYLGNADRLPRRFKTYLLVGIATNFIAKTFAVIVIFLEDLQRGVRWAYLQIKQLVQQGATPAAEEVTIPRSPLWSQAALAIGSVPVVAISWGIISGAHDYRIRRKTITLPNLPKAFDGIRIGQLSDIHSGSFRNRIAVKGGVEMLNHEKPDVVFFTGDLVNNQAAEMNDYVNVFDKVKAPLGVFSILGNHDYGDYVRWPSPESKLLNLESLKSVHKQMGWHLLLNEHHLLKDGGDALAIMGIENWGARGFSKYGKLAEAHRGTAAAAVRLLLSHDPSHWSAEVLKDYPDIDVSFAGHTHGMQFGVEIGNIKWSPVQYMYKEWAGLYEKQGQYLYVNRGFGYLGYPGRIGIPPEITIIELKRGKAA